MEKQMGTHGRDNIGCDTNTDFVFVLFYSLKSLFYTRRENKTRQLLNPCIILFAKIPLLYKKGKQN